MSLPTGIVLSGFADEASPNVEEQVALFQRLGLHGLDVRSANGVNVLDLSDEALDDIRSQAQAAGLTIQSVGSPVNKVEYSLENRSAEFRKLTKAVKAAKRLGTRRIRIFTPEVPRGQDDALWQGVRAWLAEQVALAEHEDVVLLHENDGRYYGAYPENSQRLFVEFGGPNFRAAFDFANTVLLGYRPMKDWFPWIAPYVDTLHIKDAIESEGRILPAGEGEGQIQETIELLVDRGWNGAATLEPHLQAAGPMGGFSGEQLFETAAAALFRILEKVGGRS